MGLQQPGHFNDLKPIPFRSRSVSFPFSIHPAVHHNNMPPVVPFCRCWAGTNVIRAMSYGLSPYCNLTCPGNNAELCGGW